MTARKVADVSAPHLANAELAVMDVLWDSGRATARQVREQLYPDQKNQHGTVQRLLQRLEDKGFVERDDDLPVHLFTPTLSREAYASSQLESLAQRLTGGSLAPIMTQLVEQKRLSPSEIDRLRHILDEEGDKGAGGR
jgi:predicted transcriptional regulator